ncbi:MAG TPA: substrate-binding domain-containing protein [Hyphomicrobiales bacterium]|nr:substrate-binding domain-containing protein [Hyphomicrobiales bacterium]
MIKIEIDPVWRFHKEDHSESITITLGFLNEIRATGKITSAAQAAQLSYRHAWNLIEKWSAFFDAPLVERHQGKGSALTPFGEKLVWAGQRLQARLKPQLENLSQELQTELMQFLPHGSSMLRIHASHGFAVAHLRELFNSEPDIGLDLRYVSNQNSLVSLTRGECDLAGMHLPRGSLRKRSVAAVKGVLSPDLHRVVSFVKREMGLMVKRGNPQRIDSLQRLLDPAVRFVNRDPDSGTRLLFEQLLAQHRLDGNRINGYTQIEFTHSAVASYVASNMADVAFGVEAAARQFDLDFVPLVTEDYFFVCLKQLIDTEPMKRLQAIMRSKAFHVAVSALPGYTLESPGEIKTLTSMFRKPG